MVSNAYAYYPWLYPWLNPWVYQWLPMLITIAMVINRYHWVSTVEWDRPGRGSHCLAM